MKDAGSRLSFFLNLRRYLLALAIVYCSIGLRILLIPILGPDRYPFVLLLGAVVFCSWYCGVLPSVLATLAGLLYVWRNFLPPFHSFALSDPKTQIGGMALFSVIAGVIIFLGEGHRRVRIEARTTVEKLRLTQQAARVGSYEWNIKTGLVQWTPELEGLYGLRLGTFGGKFSDWEKLVHPDDIDEAKRQVNEALQKGTFEGEWRVIWPDGSVHWILGRGYVFSDAAGHPERMMGVNIDISERKEAAKANSLLAAIVDSSDDVIISKTLEGTITTWNGSAERILGYTSEEAIGQNITLIIPEDRREEETEIIERIKSGQPVEHFETVRRRKDGTLVDLSLTISPVKDAFGRIIGASKVARDISERKKVELDRQRFIALAERCTEFIGMCDMNYQPFYLNEAALHVIGLDSLEELRNIRVSDFFFPEDREFVETEFLPKVLREGKADVEIRFRHFKTGAAIWMIYNVFVIRDQKRNTIAIATFSQNISRRKEMESTLRKNEEELRVLSSELEQKVHARTAELEQRNSEVLQQRELLRELSSWLLKAQDEERRRIARELHDSAGQLVAALSMALTGLSGPATLDPNSSKTLADAQGLVQQLSSEIRTTSYLLHPPLLDEAGLPQAITWYLQGLKERSGLETQFQCSQDFGRLPGNVELTLFRILQECLTNVHRHSGSKTATIRLGRASGSVSMEIQDYGKGISREKLSAIKAQRAGVGVTGMRERVHQLSGNMDIRSDGKGVIVSVNLPVSEVSPVELQPRQQTRAVG
jgi:PAS domain S-box-containing protein